MQLTLLLLTDTPSDVIYELVPVITGYPCGFIIISQWITSSYCGLYYLIVDYKANYRADYTVIDWAPTCGLEVY